MIQELILRYLKFLVVWLTILHNPIIANIHELHCENSYYVLEKQYVWLTLSFYNKIYYKSIKHNLDPALVCSLIHSESYDRGCRYTLKKMQEAISTAGARSFMQVMPVHYKGNPRHLHNVDINFYLGMRYLRKCIVVSHGNLYEALRKYNQGINGKRSKYTGWDSYVKPILRRYNKYLKLVKKPAVSSFFIPYKEYAFFIPYKVCPLGSK